MSITAKAKRRGFTLVELLIVVIIIAILAAIAIPKFTNATLRSKESALKGELKLLRDATELFKNDTGGYPAVIGDLAVTSSPNSCYNPTTSAMMSIVAGTWKGPYVSSVDNDPIDGAAFHYDDTTGKVTANSSDPEPATDGTNYTSW